VVFSPIFGDGAFIVNTTIPGSTSPMGCTSTLPNGWTMAINAATGGAFATSFFADSNGNFVTVNNKTVSGIQLAGTGSPSLVTVGDPGNPQGRTSTKAYLITQTSSGTPTKALIQPPSGTQGGRLNWIQRR
jgi:type IV pilus assembly protein PilY1